jgi:hypothetical protein
LNLKITTAGALCRRLLSVMAALALTHVCCAQDVTMQREAQLKAAYVFNFMKFVDWDARGTDKVIDVCFVDEGDIRDALSEATVDKLVATRSIMVRSVSRAGWDCDVIYVPGETRKPSPWPPGSSALIVGESPTLTADGGIIQLYTENNRLRFIINVGNARRAGLQISSNLLKLATTVEQ